MFGRHFDEKDFLISKVGQFWFILDYRFETNSFLCCAQSFPDVHKQDCVLQSTITMFYVVEQTKRTMALDHGSS